MCARRASLCRKFGAVPPPKELDVEVGLQSGQFLISIPVGIAGGTYATYLMAIESCINSSHLTKHSPLSLVCPSPSCKKVLLTPVLGKNNLL